MRIQAIELKRKYIHLSSLWMPVAVFCLEQKAAFLLFLPLTAVVVAFDLWRLRSDRLSRFFDGFFSGALRDSERLRGQLTGGSYMMLGVSVCLFFPKEISVTALTVLMVSDTAAALVGQAFGRRHYMGKSLEGCLAFLLSGVAVLAVLGQMMPHGPHYYTAGSAAVMAALFAEIHARRMGMDDNLLIPLAVAVTMSLLS